VSAIDQILRFAVQNGVSDVHLKVGRPPIYRKDGQLIEHRKAAILQPEYIQDWINEIAAPRHLDRLKEVGEVDFVYHLGGVGRFRINAFYQRELAGLVARVVPGAVQTVEQLGLPDVVNELCNLSWGLVLVTGATGSGKSTTLSSMIDVINKTRKVHVLTIEDPIEYVHEDQQAVVNQREVGQDTGSFSAALRAALRQDPDVIMIGEMRDHETMRIALEAAETGHLVLSTLHTIDAPETITRIISMFPEHEQPVVRGALSRMIMGIVSQRLLARKSGDGRIAACEVMMPSKAIRDCISEQGRIDEIHEFMLKGRGTYGSQTFDQSLVTLFRDGQIDEQTVYSAAQNTTDIKLQLSGIS